MLILILMLILMIQRNYPLHGHRRYHRELELSNREPPSGAGALRPGGFEVGVEWKGAIWIVFGNRRLKALKVKLYLSPRDYKQCNGPVAVEQYYSTTCEGKESTGPARWCLGDSHRPTRLRWTLRARLGQHDRSRTPPKGACRNTRGTCGRWAVGMSISVRMSTVCLSN